MSASLHAWQLIGRMYLVVQADQVQHPLAQDGAAPPLRIGLHRCVGHVQAQALPLNDLRSRALAGSGTS